uniref:Metallophosphoesterase n=1 Tax=Schlesneria paludicola TaxID=360056 RepID=A0A7C4LM47_9PLAN
MLNQRADHGNGSGAECQVIRTRGLRLSIKLATKIQGPVAVIGDVHGQVEKLRVVLQQLQDLPQAQQRWIVFIGDFVDRGPDPKGAVDMFLQLLKQHPKTTAVMGNHEFAMCGALGWLPVSEGGHWGRRWLQHYDAETTLASYGVDGPDLEALNREVPDAHRAVLSGLPWLVEHPQYLFVHAGLDPNAPFDVQYRILQNKDFALNRPQWLCEQELVHADPPPDCPFTVVSGHVKVPAVQFRRKRVLVDTTGGLSGELSCVLLPEKRVISSAGSGPAETAGSGGRSWWKFWG